MWVLGQPRQARADPAKFCTDMCDLLLPEPRRIHDADARVRGILRDVRGPGEAADVGFACGMWRPVLSVGLCHYTRRAPAAKKALRISSLPLLVSDIRVLSPVLIQVLLRSGVNLSRRTHFSSHSPLHSALGIFLSMWHVMHSTDIGHRLVVPVTSGLHSTRRV